MGPDEFNVRLELRIDWSELDYFKHVNNVSFFKYIQAARVNYWDKIGLRKFHLDTNIGPMLASTNCEFHKPLFFPGRIKILTRTEFIKKTSFGFEHLILNEADDTVAKAKDVMVMFDFINNEKVLFQTEFREQIEKLEGKKF